MINKERLINSFLNFVAIDSESKNERNFGMHIIDELNKIGLETEVDTCGQDYGSNFGNIIARLKGNRAGETVLFSCHLDTVTPGVGIKPVIEDGVIYSDGTTILGADDKAGIAAIIEALKVIQENNLLHADIEVVFTILEENGLYGSKCLDYKSLNSKVAYILDENDVGRIIVQGPAHDNIQVRIHGKSAHAGVAPEEGISAIVTAAKAISKMKLLRIDEETTANIGSIHGGSETNIVTAEVLLTGEARSLDDVKLTSQTNHMIECFEEAAKETGALIEVEKIRTYSAFNIDPDDLIVKKVEQAFAKIGLDCTICRTGGGSDTNVYNEKGLKAITLGIGEMKPHTLDEHIKTQNLVKVAQLVIAIIEEYLINPPVGALNLSTGIKNMIAIVNGKINTITNGIISSGIVLISEGKIFDVGENIQIPEGATIIDATDCWVTPGFIDCHTHISTFYEPRNMPGLASDANECSDPITPHIRAIDALNPFDPAIEKTRVAGFTTVYTGPGSGNLIGGTGIGLKLRGITADEMVIPGTEQMKMALGENPKRAFGTDRKMPITRMGSAALIRQTLFDALNYSEKIAKYRGNEDKEPAPNFKLESLLKVVRGEQKVRIHSHRSDDIRTAIRLAEEFHLDYSIEHATEGYLIKDILAKKNVTCVVGPLLLEPVKQEVWGLTLENPGVLTDAGVKVCLTADTGSKTAWLPMEIGLLLRRGLSELAAFNGITIYPAELLGISDRVGSIAIGKDADIAIFDGYPFSNLTMCQMTMIDGEIYHNTLSK